MQIWQLCPTMENTQFWLLLLCTQCLTLVETDSSNTSLYHEFQTHGLMYTQYIKSFALLLRQRKDSSLTSWHDPL